MAPPHPFALEQIFSEHLCHKLRARLSAALVEMALPFEEQMVTNLLHFVGLLYKWNQVHNFTASIAPEQMLVKHVLDSLSVSSFLVGAQILDLGTGPGLPGVPLALLCPNKQFTLLDSRQKTFCFLSQAKNLLSLQNVSLICQRVQQFQVSSGFSTIVTRAYATLPLIIKEAKHLLAPNGLILAMKGRKQESLVGEEFEVVAKHALLVPGLAAKRQVVLIQKRNKRRP